MMCPLRCDSKSLSRTDTAEKYNLLNVVDLSLELQDVSDEKTGDSFLLQDTEDKASRSNSGFRTGCRLMEAQGLASDHFQRELAFKKLKRAILICLVFMILETVGGKFAGSLAVLADAAHILSDVAGFAISLLALRASAWVATPRHTFGFFRLEVLGALVSVQIIWVMTGIIVYEAIQRLYHGIHIVDGRLMFFVALVGLVLNFMMIFILGPGHDHSDGGQGHSHFVLHEYNHIDDHDHLEDLEDGHCRKHNKSSFCNDSHEQGHTKHSYHDDHQKLGGRDPLESELFRSGGGHRDWHDRHSCCCTVDDHLQSKKQVDIKNSSDVGNSVPINELDFFPDILQDSNVGYPHHVHLELKHEQKFDLPTYQIKAHAAIFALRDEETIQMKYVNDGSDANLPSEKLISLRNSAEQLFEDEIQGQALDCSREGALNINLRGAYIHALGDLIQNIGVLIAGLIIWFKPEWQVIDLLSSLAFSMLVMMTTMKMMKDVMRVLMESASRDLDVEILKSGLLQISGVSAVLDFHVWALTPGTNILACHLEIYPGAVAKEVLRDATEHCYNLHQIKHVTIQIEEMT